jgi:tetratricopeptide (TPR) repeat protein
MVKKIFIAILVIFLLVIVANPIISEYNQRKTVDYHKNELSKAEKAIELNSNDAIAWNNKGVAHTYLHEYKAAVVAFEKATEIDSTNFIIFNNKGYAFDNNFYFDNVGYGNIETFDKAVLAYDQAIVLNPQNSTSWCLKGWALYFKEHYNPDNTNQMDGYEKALKSFDTAIDLDSQYPHAWLGRAMVYEAMSGTGTSFNTAFLKEEASKAREMVEQLSNGEVVAPFNVYSPIYLDYRV